jgi:hypothetical protein
MDGHRLMSGFYKIINGELAFARRRVIGPSFALRRAKKDTYTYPVEGWYWFDSRAEAIATLKPKLEELVLTDMERKMVLRHRRRSL